MAEEGLSSIFLAGHSHVHQEVLTAQGTPQDDKGTRPLCSDHTVLYRVGYPKSLCLVSWRARTQERATARTIRMQLWWRPFYGECKSWLFAMVEGGPGPSERTYSKRGGWWLEDACCHVPCPLASHPILSRRRSWHAPPGRRRGFATGEPSRASIFQSSNARSTWAQAHNSVCSKQRCCAFTCASS